MRKALSALVFSLAALPALAAPERACWLGYQGFEEKVPQHMDLDTCPGRRVNPEQNFCRIVLNGDQVTIYQFQHAPQGPCMVRADSYRFNEFVARFGSSYVRP